MSFVKIRNLIGIIVKVKKENVIKKTFKGYHTFLLNVFIFSFLLIFCVAIF